MRALPHLLLFTLLGLALYGCGNEPAGGLGGGLPQVTYLELSPGTVTLTAELAGRTSAWQMAEIRPQVSGILQKRLFVEGALVKEGEPLYQIDPALFEAAVKSAKAGLQQATANFRAAKLLADRYSKLVGSQAVSRQEYDNAVAASQQAEASVAAAQAALTTAEINLGYTRITSPISGVIGKSSVTAGALVAAGQPTALATVQQIDPVYVDVTQSSTQLLRLKKSVQEKDLTRTKEEGAEVTLILPDGSLYPHKGTLLFSEVSVDAGTGSYILRAKLPNPDGLLMQNLFVRLRVPTLTTNKAILIPQRVVSYNQKGEPITKVLVPAVAPEGQKLPSLPDPAMKAYTLETRKLTLAESQGNFWVVAAGLAPGDKLLLDGGMKIRPGMNMVIGTLHKETPAPKNGQAPQ